MKIKITFFLFLASFTNALPNEQDGHFFFNLKGNDISTTNILDSLYQWLDIDGNTSFKEIQKEKDEIGMQHQSYQQLYKGIPINGSIILIHSKNNIVETINGVIMRNADEIEVCSEPFVLKSANSEMQETTIVPFERNGRKTFRTCFRKEDFENHKIDFIDTKTGDTLKTLSTLYNANVTASGYTWYHGWQEMTCDLTDNVYSLKNPLVETYYAGNNENKLEEVLKYRDDCMLYKYASPRMGGMLLSVTITNASKDWWYSSLSDTKPDLYIVIEDALGNKLYESKEHYDDIDPPIIFTFDINIASTILVGEGTTIKIYDYDPVGSDDYGGSVTINDIEPGTHSWSNSKTSGEYTIIANPAIDVHWGMEKTLSYYYDVLGRIGYQNLPTITYQFVDPYSEHGTHFYPNAYATYDKNGTGCMLYGLGDFTTFGPLVSLDIMAHEYTHMVTNFNGNGGLEYQGESGALNESFSDIFGTAVEFYTLGEEANWTIGESVSLTHSNLRDLSNPKNTEGMDQQPDTYKGEYWSDTEDLANDHGGVHTNSGVQNYWFYLLSVGGHGTNDNNEEYVVTGIGIEKAAKIAYRNLTFYLTPQATYEDAVEGSMAAAKDLYGESSPEQKSVFDAWCAVGLCIEKYESLFQSTNDELNDQLFTFHIEDGILYLASEVDTEIRIYNVVGQPIHNTISLKAKEKSFVNIGTNKIVIIKTNAGVEKCVVK
ncbi:MAG: M4 family metallopeptidase [Paludibacteraceae bacterium]|nr:M4 family metallopeptidase [Paludibacteraceae bacterium]